LRRRSRRSRICFYRPHQLRAHAADFTPFSGLAIYPHSLGGQLQVQELLHARF
jgi:hypothetical protein